MYSTNPTPIARVNSILSFRGVEALRLLVEQAPVVNWHVEVIKGNGHAAVRLVDELARRGIYAPGQLSCAVRGDRLSRISPYRCVIIHKSNEVELHSKGGLSQKIALHAMEATLLHNPYAQIVNRANALVVGAALVKENRAHFEMPVYEDGKLIAKEFVYVSDDAEVRVRYFEPDNLKRHSVLASSVTLHTVSMNARNGVGINIANIQGQKYYFGAKDTKVLLTMAPRHVKVELN